MPSCSKTRSSCARAVLLPASAQGLSLESDSAPASSGIVTHSCAACSGSASSRSAQSALTRPASDDTTRLYWDGRDAQGELVPEGDYVLAAEALVGTQRQKATVNVRVGS